MKSVAKTISLFDLREQIVLNVDSKTPHYIGPKTRISMSQTITSIKNQALETIRNKQYIATSTNNQSDPM